MKKLIFIVLFIIVTQQLYAQKVYFSTGGGLQFPTTVSGTNFGAGVSITTALGFVTKKNTLFALQGGVGFGRKSQTTSTTAQYLLDDKGKVILLAQPIESSTAVIDLTTYSINGVVGRKVGKVLPYGGIGLGVIQTSGYGYFATMNDIQGFLASFNTAIVPSFTVGANFDIIKVEDVTFGTYINFNYVVNGASAVTIGFSF